MMNENEWIEIGTTSQGSVLYAARVTSQVRFEIEDEFIRTYGIAEYIRRCIERHAIADVSNIEWIHAINSMLNEGQCPVCTGEVYATENRDLGPDRGLVCMRCNMRFISDTTWQDRPLIRVYSNSRYAEDVRGML